MISGREPSGRQGGSDDAVEILPNRNLPDLSVRGREGCGEGDYCGENGERGTRGASKKDRSAHSSSLVLKWL
jgi:hypothetical protein